MQQECSQSVDEIVEKPCSVCGAIKPLDDYSFDKRHNDGRQSRCRDCTRAYQRQYGIDRPENVAASKRKDYELHKDRVIAYAKTNAVRINEQARVRTAERRKNDPEFAERRREASRRYTAANPEAVAARIRDWGQRHPEKSLGYAHTRRARMHEVEYEFVDVLVLAERDHWVCGICDEPIDPAAIHPDRGYRSIDHVVPLSFGGPHTYDNTRISHLHCNVRRGAARGESWEPLDSSGVSLPSIQSACG